MYPSATTDLTISITIEIHPGSENFPTWVDAQAIDSAGRSESVTDDSPADALRQLAIRLETWS